MTETISRPTRINGAAPTPATVDTVSERELRRLLAALTAVHDGDFGARLPQDGGGLPGEIAAVFNGVAGRLSRLTSEVTRVASEAATGEQAVVPGASGAWRDLTDSVNVMADTAASGDGGELPATMGHELRSPLNSMLVLARLLAQNPTRNLTPEQVRYADTIHSAGSDLLRLINDLLDRPKTDAGRWEAGVEPLDPRAVLDDVPAPRAPETAGPGRLLVLESRERGLLELLARDVEADLPGARGPLRITAVTGADAAMRALAGKGFRCVVLDLDADDAEAFLRRLDAVPDLRALPVLAYHARTLPPAREHLLRSLARTRPLERLPSLDELRERITLHLSAEAPHEVPALDPRAAEEPAAPADGGLAGRRVLVVDDDARNVYALTSVLELHGAEVVYADNGRAGVEALASTPGIDLVLMDVMMPEMDGYAATAAIRAMPEHADLPIIMVTAKAMPGDRERSLACGASDHVTKPVDAADLLARMRDRLGP
ncbi:ATP-binding response regulator [Actinomadura kijaniata]|uniref:response regulator n=1 Tax=Actinomadura kijaniata TaxID=46161 RepID=UPI0008294E87